MSTYIVVVGLMLAGLIFTAAALAAEVTITHQMAHSQYRFVWLLRITRRMVFLASVAFVAFTAYVLQVLPAQIGFPLLLLAVLIGLSSQYQALFYDDWATVVRLGLNPWIAMGMSAGLWLQDSMMGIPAFIMAVLIWAQTHRMSRHKTEQDWLYIRD